MSWLDKLTGTVWRDGLDTRGLTSEEVSGLFAEMPSVNMQWRRRPLWLGYALRLRPGAVAPTTPRTLPGALPFYAKVGRYNAATKIVEYGDAVTVIAFVVDWYRHDRDAQAEAMVCAVVMHEGGTFGTVLIHDLKTIEGE